MILESITYIALVGTGMWLVIKQCRNIWRMR